MMFSLFKLIGIVLFLYLVWRDLSEDYQDDPLVSYAWVAVMGMLLMGRVVHGLLNWGIWNDSLTSWFLVWQKSGFSYIGAFIGWLAATAWYVRVQDWKLWPFLEDSIGYFFLMVSVMLLDDLLRSNFSLEIVFYLLTAVTGWLTVGLIKKKYRSFWWYKSGRKGFGFFFTVLTTSIILAVTSRVFGQSYWLTGLLAAVGLLSVVELFIIGEVFKNK